MEEKIKEQMKKLQEKEKEKKKKKAGADVEPDVLLLIFARLTPAALARCAAVCTAWHNVIKNLPLLWEKARKEQTKELKLRLQRPDYVLATEMDFKTIGVAELQRAHLVQGIMESRCWKAHSSRVDSCRMSMDTIVSGSADQTVRVWSVRSLRCVEEYKVPGIKAPVVDLEFDENKIIGAAGTEVWVWNRNRGGRVTHKMGGHSQRLYCVCYTEPEVAVGCADGCTRVYDMYSGRCSRIFRSHSAAVTSISIQDETQLLASGSRDGSVQVCDISSGQNVGRLLRPNPMREVGCLQWGMNGCLLFAATSVGRLCCWDMRKQEILWQEGNDKSVMASLHLQEYAPATLVTGSMDGRVRVWDSDSGRMLKHFAPLDNHRADAHREPDLGAGPLPSSGAADRLSRSMPVVKQPPILCVRVGSTRVLTAHTDGSLTLCQFRIQDPTNSGTRRWDL